jgi:hypothetical protein
MADALKKVFADRKAQVSPGFPTDLGVRSTLKNFDSVARSKMLISPFDMIFCWDITGRTVSTLPAYHHTFLPARFHLHSVFSRLKRDQGLLMLTLPHHLPTHLQTYSAFVTFLTAGYPTRSSTVPAMLGMERGGADVIELGVPFSDPIADGRAIQEANTVSTRWISDLGLDL